MKNEPTTTTPAEIAHLLRQGASMAREMIGLRRFNTRFGEMLARDYEQALAELMPGTGLRDGLGAGEPHA